MSTARRLSLGPPPQAAPPLAPGTPERAGAPPPRPAWLPVWSVPSAMRALRAVLVIPPLFALTYEGIGNLQIALFTAFGGFATLVVASFGGSRRDKVVAHLGLAVTGSVGLIIGTAVGGVKWLAVLVTIPVAFGIFFAGVAGPNAASGVIAALFPYVLSVATPGQVSMIPDRLAGWWLASVVATAAVLVLSPPSPGDRLRAAAAGSARALADALDAAVTGTATAALHDRCVAAKRQLLDAFATTPYRPTGLATADQGMASVVHLLEWCTALVTDATEGHLHLDRADPPDLELCAESAAVLRQAGDLLAGPDGGQGSAPLPDFGDLEGRREASAAFHRSAVTAEEEAGGGDYESMAAAARYAFHAQVISIAVQALVADALIATRRADPETIAARRRGWFGVPPEGTPAERRAAGLSGAVGVLARHASIRSVWFLNSLRGSLALAAAVGVADVSGVQHGFWVVLGTLSVLRTNAASTGSTALRALGGTVAGFVIGALLMVGIGHSEPALWAALPFAVALAAYAPGALPFTFGQAGFTIVIVILFNLLAPVGWTVGLLRIQDVALGCAVSLVVGVLFWPRGASSVVGDDLADAFRRGAAYLTQSVDWALGDRHDPPEGGAGAVTAGIRLDEALRGFLAEQGAKHLSKQDLWTLVMATTRLRLTAYSLASLHAPAHARHHRGVVYARRLLAGAAADLETFYERVAVLVGRPAARDVLLPITVPAFTGLDANGSTSSPPAGTDGARVKGPDGAGETDGADEAGDAELVKIITSDCNPQLLWVQEHLQHLSSHAETITTPATHVAELRRQPWWR